MLCNARPMNSRVTPGPSPGSPRKLTESRHAGSTSQPPPSAATAASCTASCTSSRRQRCRKPMGTRQPCARKSAKSSDASKGSASSSASSGGGAAPRRPCQRRHSACASHLSMAPRTKRSPGTRGPRSVSSPKRSSCAGSSFASRSNCRKPRTCQKSEWDRMLVPAPSSRCTTFASATSATARTSCSNICTGHSKASSRSSAFRSCGTVFPSTNTEARVTNSAVQIAISMSLPANTSCNLRWHFKQKSTSQPTLQANQYLSCIGLSQLSQARCVSYARRPPTVK
mmetsp:Transcript_4715/g.12981  ORF Transcript_4715/g.12981 Transcript_4715/m.12981 type:complete len:284 (+) Transcript_4715:929-1780(+)